MMVAVEIEGNENIKSDLEAVTGVSSALDMVGRECEVPE